MADDHNQRPYRSRETIARTGQARSSASASGSDPLAELARLIGQTDPFGDLGREPRQPAPAAAHSGTSMDWSAAAPQSFAPHQPAPPVAPTDLPPQHEPPFDQGYAQAHPADLYQVEQPVPAYLTQRGSGGFEQHGYQPGGEGEDVYDDLPPQRRRLSVLAIAGVFALAVVGTAGAFGYRVVFGTSGSNMPPPVIKADTAPMKIVPEAAKNSGKLITERVNGADEKMVSREEKPVDLKDKIATPVFPPVTGTGEGASGPAVTATAGNGVVGGEPKKVHTITIRPDQQVADATATGAQPQQTAPLAQPQPPKAPAPPLAPAKPQQAAAAPAPTHEAPRAAQAAPRAPAVPARSANAPLSLNPNTASAPRQPTRLASTSPTSLDPAPSGNAASPARGGYAVQVSSQRSEAEAQSAYHALQGKYGSVLGGRSMFVHKVELGGKGTYYRAMVGPFASQAEASKLCSSLKSAGGSCLVQRN